MGSVFPWIADLYVVVFHLSSGQLLFTPTPLCQRCGDSVVRTLESFGWEPMTEEKPTEPVRLNEYGQPIKLVPLVGHVSVKSVVEAKARASKTKGKN